MSSYCQLNQKSDQSTIFDVIVLIVSFHSDLYLPTGIMNIHSKEILCGCVLDFRHSVFSCIAPPVEMHAKEYTIYHI